MDNVIIYNGELLSLYNHLLYPWTCQPLDRDWVKNSNNDIINFAKLTSDIIDLLKYAYSTKSPPISGFDNYFDILNELKNDYDEYLDVYINNLIFYDNITNNVINILENSNGNSHSFSFLNVKYIKNNFIIILKYSKYSLGKNIYIIGICLIILGCSLILLIPSLILFIYNINISLDFHNYEDKEAKKANEYKINNDPITSNDIFENTKKINNKNPMNSSILIFSNNNNSKSETNDYLKLSNNNINENKINNESNQIKIMKQKDHKKNQFLNVIYEKENEANEKDGESSKYNEIKFNLNQNYQNNSQSANSINSNNSIESENKSDSNKNSDIGKSEDEYRSCDHDTVVESSKNSENESSERAIHKFINSNKDPYDSSYIKPKIILLRKEFDDIKKLKINLNFFMKICQMKIIILVYIID